MPSLFSTLSIHRIACVTPIPLASLLTRFSQDAHRSNSSSFLLAPDRRGGGAKPPELLVFVDGCRWSNALLLPTPIRHRCCRTRSFCCPPRLGLPGRSDCAVRGATGHGLGLSRPGAHPRLQARALWTHHRCRRRRCSGARRVGGEQLQGRFDLDRRRRVVGGDLCRARVREKNGLIQRKREEERERERKRNDPGFFENRALLRSPLTTFPTSFPLFYLEKTQKKTAPLSSTSSSHSTARGTRPTGSWARTASSR